MLKVIEDTLLEFKLIQANERLRYNINIGTGLAMSISAYKDSLDFFQIKISEIDNLANEYDAQVRAWSQYDNLVPRPLAHCARKGWYIIVMQGINHSAFPYNLHDYRSLSLFLSKPVQQGLLQYFRTCGEHKIYASNRETHHKFLDRLETHYINSEHAKIASHWVNLGRRLITDTLPHLAQHGDFVRNNLALSEGKLIIFDWEDFEKFELPGLDICTLILSLSTSPANFIDIMDANSKIGVRIESFINQCCNLCHLNIKTFKKLIPLYLLIFLYIKSDYGKSAQNRIQSYLIYLNNIYHNGS